MDHKVPRTVVLSMTKGLRDMGALGSELRSGQQATKKRDDQGQGKEEERPT